MIVRCVRDLISACIGMELSHPGKRLQILGPGDRPLSFICVIRVIRGEKEILRSYRQEIGNRKSKIGKGGHVKAGLLDDAVEVMEQ